MNRVVSPPALTAVQSERVPTWAGAVRYPSIQSTGRTVRIFADTAVVHGSELDEVKAGGKRYSMRYLYLDVLLRRDGEWRIVASQLARLNEEVLPS